MSSLTQGEKIYFESNSMVMMEDTRFKRQNGGFEGKLSCVVSLMVNGFQQHIEAVRSAGDCLLSPCVNIGEYNFRC